MTNSQIHSTAMGYQKSSDTYEKGRPAYTEEAVFGLAERMKLRPENQILELGAGTGKFTRVLVEKYPNIVAFEPVAAMRDKFAEVLPSIKVYEGTGEKISVEDASADAVIVANAFHWFDSDAALKEIHRVLKPGGSLGLIWNIDGVFTSSWGQQIDAWLDELEGDTPQYKTGKWKEAFQRTNLFSPLNEHRFSSRRNTTHSEVINRVVSISFIASLTEARRNEFQRKIESWISSHPDSKSRKVLEVSFDTKIYWCSKK
jgi:ubiquinone/menaquinone biosynthesis C-methylase UbiE